MSAKRILDRVHSRASITALELQPAEYARLVREEVLAGEHAGTAITLADLEGRDATLAQAIADIDELAMRVMRIELDHTLADDTAIPTQTRKVFAATVVAYASNLSLLEDRVRDIAARGRAPDADMTARMAVDAAKRTLALREALRRPLLDLARDLAQSTTEPADKRAKDRTLDESWRKKWSAARRELEAVAAQPGRIALAPWPSRLAAHPEQIDEPGPEADASFADMIEMD
ncbi:MAG TPA: hypothetical protein VMZ53_09920 [Kofleriaceae bacterium]|nr:hypothetical protein [Kofleriaceae bacterium]